MSITYRQFDGSLEDAIGILEVEAVCWNESLHSPTSAQRMLNDDSQPQVCWLAEQAGQVVGFMHAFATQTPDVSRWELDLLAVRPAARGKGVGTALVKRATESAPPGIMIGRALIAPENMPSATAFARAGFVTDSVLHAVYERDVPDTNKDQLAIPANVSLQQVAAHTWLAKNGPDSAVLTTVHTLLYSGIWLEGRLSAPLLKTAQATAFQLGLDIVGVIVPAAAADVLAQLSRQHFRPIGEYAIWTRTLSIIR